MSVLLLGSQTITDLAAGNNAHCQLSFVGYEPDVTLTRLQAHSVGQALLRLRRVLVARPP
jgi:hypothetical protein